jgi:hypothetical protein
LAVCWRKAAVSFSRKPKARERGRQVGNSAHGFGLRLDDDAHGFALRLNDDAHAFGLRLNDDALRSGRFRQ